MLDPFSRGAILLMSTLCIGGTLALAPTRARSSNDVPAVTAVALRSATRAQVFEETIARDPFAAEPAPATVTADAALASSTQQAPSRKRAGVEPLPSNLSSENVPSVPGDPSVPGEPTDPAMMPRVMAIVTGVHPYAMIQTAGNSEMKGLGDRVGLRSVVAIDINGVTLAGGRHLPVNRQGAGQ